VATGTLPGEAIPDRPGHRGNAWLKSAWTTLMTWVRREPATAQALILAFIALGIAFGWWQWTDAQTGAVVGIAAALLGMFVRSQVTPLVQPTTKGRRLIPAPDEPPAPPAGQ
jgi:MFS superfamily sulfate permease-like transporter